MMSLMVGVLFFAVVITAVAKGSIVYGVLFAFLGGLLAVYMTREQKPVTTQFENQATSVA